MDENAPNIKLDGVHRLMTAHMCNDMDRLERIHNPENF